MQTTQGRAPAIDDYQLQFLNVEIAMWEVVRPDGHPSLFSDLAPDLTLSFFTFPLAFRSVYITLANH